MYNFEIKCHIFILGTFICFLLSSFLRKGSNAFRRYYLSLRSSSRSTRFKTLWIKKKMAFGRCCYLPGCLSVTPRVVKIKKKGIFALRWGLTYESLSYHQPHLVWGLNIKFQHIIRLSLKTLFFLKYCVFIT